MITESVGISVSKPHVRALTQDEIDAVAGGPGTYEAAMAAIAEAYDQISSEDPQGPGWQTITIHQGDTAPEDLQDATGSGWATAGVIPSDNGAGGYFAWMRYNSTLRVIHYGIEVIVPGGPGK